MGLEYLENNTRKRVRAAVKRAQDNLERVGDEWSGHKWSVRLIRNTDDNERLYEAYDSERDSLYRVNVTDILGYDHMSIDEITQKLRKGVSDTNSEKTEKALNQMKDKRKS